MSYPSPPLDAATLRAVRDEFQRYRDCFWSMEKPPHREIGAFDFMIRVLADHIVDAAAPRPVETTGNISQPMSVPPPPPPEPRDAIETLEYQARANAKCLGGAGFTCREIYVAQPSRWCSGCLIAGLLERRAEDVAQIHRWYREGVELAQCGNPGPTSEEQQAEGGQWRARGYQWFAANLDRQALRAQVQTLSGGCGCIYGGPGIGIDYECDVHRQQRADIAQATTDALIAVVEQCQRYSAQDGLEHPEGWCLMRHEVLAALRAATPPKVR